MRRMRVLLAAMLVGGFLVVAGPAQPASAATCTFTGATATISYSPQAAGYLYIGSVSLSHSGCTSVLVTARFQPTIEVTTPGTGVPSTCTPVLSTCVLATGWIFGSRTGVNVYADFWGVGSNVAHKTGVCPILGPAFGLHPTCSFNL